MSWSDRWRLDNNPAFICNYSIDSSKGWVEIRGLACGADNPAELFYFCNPKPNKKLLPFYLNRPTANFMN
jgi:hypothetical protein